MPERDHRRGWPVNIDPAARLRLRGVIDEITSEPPDPEDTRLDIARVTNERARRHTLSQRYPQDRPDSEKSGQ